MKKQDGETSRNRRNFLKAASGAAIALAAAKNNFAQSSNSKSAPQKEHGRTAPADRGIWITWYDLPMEGRDAYFSWLHGTYLPGLLKRPGYLWAAHYASQDLEGGAENATRYKHVDDPRVGKGYHYMLLIAAADANVFGDPVPSLINAALPEQGKKMLAMRTGERMNIFTETGQARRPRARRLQGRHDRRSLRSDRELRLRPGIRGGDARRICSGAAAENVRYAVVRQDAEAEFGRRLGEARNYLRIRVQGRF